jgi:tRNA(fMet)-specific endonuclease VapC
LKYVLDTNIIVAALNGHERVMPRLRAVAPDDIGIPLLAVGELLYGAYNSRRVAENIAKVEALRSRFPVIAVTPAIVERYAEVRSGLAKQGRPKGDFDLVIAASALEVRARLITNDAALKDGAIAGLSVEDWLEDVG